LNSRHYSALIPVYSLHFSLPNNTAMDMKMPYFCHRDTISMKFACRTVQHPLFFKQKRQNILVTYYFPFNTMRIILFNYLMSHTSILLWKNQLRL
jgi:hypothetical protein